MTINKNRKLNGGVILQRYALLFATILLCMVFGLLSQTFFTMGNIMNILSSTVILCIAALGLSLVMITGEIDFACGSELAAGACITAVLAKVGVNYILAVCLAILFCAMVGALNGFLHTRIGIPGFIATMGVSFVVDGFNKMITGSTRIFSSQWGSIFVFIGQKKIAGVIPVSVILLILIAIGVLIYTEAMTNGRKLYAVGANSDTCRYIGIDARKEKMKAFIISAMLCGVAGIVNASQINAATPYLGSSTLVNLLTMLMLGATFYRAGVFNVPGTLVGALLVNVINNGMVLIGAETWQQYAVQGIVMLAAVTIITILNARSRKGVR